MKNIDVDDWLDKPTLHDDNEIYAKFVIDYFRLPAWKKIAYKKWMGQYKLFCIYEDKKYRVTGASRFGDIFLNADFNAESGYQLRVHVNECYNWSND